MNGGRAQTAGKAHAAGASSALTPLLVWGVARLTGAVEPPPLELVQEALGLLAFSGLSGAAAWLGAYWKRNFAKVRRP